MIHGGRVNYGAAHGPGCYASRGELQCGEPSKRYVLACVHEHVSPPIDLCDMHAPESWVCIDCEDKGCYGCTAFVKSAPV